MATSVTSITSDHSIIYYNGIAAFVKVVSAGCQGLFFCVSAVGPSTHSCSLNFMMRMLLIHLVTVGNSVCLLGFGVFGSGSWDQGKIVYLFTILLDFIFRVALSVWYMKIVYDNLINDVVDIYIGEDESQLEEASNSVIGPHVEDMIQLEEASNSILEHVNVESYHSDAKFGVPVQDVNFDETNSHLVPHQLVTLTPLPSSNGTLQVPAFSHQPDPFPKDQLAFTSPLPPTDSNYEAVLLTALPNKYTDT